MAQQEKKTTHRAPAESHSTAESSKTGSLLTSAAIIGVAALIEPELLAGMAIGAGIVLASRWFPNLAGDLLRPIAKTALKAGYAAITVARETVAEIVEGVEDTMAEARAEQESAERLH